MPAVKKRILVVDDDAAIRRSLARILRAAGHDVCVANDGFQAIEIAVDFQPDLLLVDIRMPGMDGVETFRRLRQQSPTLVAICMTAYAGSEKTTEAIETGALCVQSKPLKIEPLLEMVKSSFATAPVLIAEDDPALLKSIARAIRASGIEVETVTSFSDAIRLLRQRPDRVVIADVFLEGGFGYELLQEAVDETGPTPFILITGHADWLESETARSLQGKAVCIPKPVDIEKLIEQVKRA